MAHFTKPMSCHSGSDLTIALNLYVDDFEICNPLGTSRKKHKITAVYWVLADVPSLLRSELNSIFLAILCKAEDVKRFGYSAVLEPLLKDGVVLEEEGLYVPALGRRVKGIVWLQTISVPILWGDLLRAFPVNISADFV